jgi:hypothetical protein
VRSCKEIGFKKRLSPCVYGNSLLLFVLSLNLSFYVIFTGINEFRDINKSINRQACQGPAQCLPEDQAFVKGVDSVCMMSQTLIEASSISLKANPKVMSLKMVRILF